MMRIHRSDSPRAIRLIAFTLSYGLLVTTVVLPLSRSAVVGAKGRTFPSVSSSRPFIQSRGLFGAARERVSFFDCFRAGRRWSTERAWAKPAGPRCGESNNASRTGSSAGHSLGPGLH